MSMSLTEISSPTKCRRRSIRDVRAAGLEAIAKPATTSTATSVKVEITLGTPVKIERSEATSPKAPIDPVIWYGFRLPLDSPLWGGTTLQQ